jgi:predicted RND superfamily exporter protein
MTTFASLPPDAEGPEWLKRLADRLIYYRRGLIVFFTLLTLVLAGTATLLRTDAGFTKMIPLDHPFMQVFLKYQSAFGNANRVLLAIHAKEGSIYTPEGLDLLKKATEEVFYIEGVERSSVTSLFTPNVRFTEVVEEGFRGGNVVSADYAGRPDQIEQVKANVAKSDWVGRIISTDGSSAMVVASLQESDPQTGERTDLKAVAKRFESIREQLQTDTHSIHIIGFAKAVGDIADGAAGVLVFFALAFVVTTVLLYFYSCSAMLTFYALGCAVIPVVWLLGLMPLVGLGLDPLSILVPFLIFAIAVSHAVQMTNAWRLEILAGRDAKQASHQSFCKLFVPGAIALLANGLGFLVIAFVPIEIVRELAYTATLGVLVMILSNKLLLPALLSYRQNASFRPPSEKSMVGVWRFLARLTRKGPASVVILICLVVLALGLWVAKDRQVGDLGQGVPELRPDSRYNQDTELITQRFAIGVDVMQVIVEVDGKDSPCVSPTVMEPLSEFELIMRQNPGVTAVSGLAGFTARVSQAYAENNIKWRALPADEQQIAQGVGAATRLGNMLMNPACTALPVSIYTQDHQAPTIRSLVTDVEDFAKAFEREDLRFEIGLGNLSVMAATNEVVQSSDHWVNLALFGAVTLLCLITFRSVAITLCIILPLALVTVLCNAVMTGLGIGLKVNTLPVVALGVGVGVDYGIYLFERIRHELQKGESLEQSVFEALRQRGTASLFTAVTMTVSVLTWLGSELQFQSDMGLLLGFMFLVNLLGAVLLLPALAAFFVLKHISANRHAVASA